MLLMDSNSSLTEVPTEVPKTQAQVDINLLVAARGCPITGGCPETRILKTSFVQMCKIHQNGGDRVSTTGFRVKRKNMCPCPTGILVLHSKEFVAPEGVIFINIDSFTIQKPTPKRTPKPESTLVPILKPKHKPEPEPKHKPKPKPKPKAAPATAPTPKVKQRNFAVKLTVEKVLTIRAEHKTGDILMKDIAEKYGVKTNTISDVINRKTWRNV